MKFNNSAPFNRGQFNQASLLVSGEYYGTCGMRFLPQAFGFSSQVPLPEALALARFLPSAKISVDPPFGLATATMRYTPTANMSAYLSYTDCSATMKFSVSQTMLRINNDEDLVLSGLNFAPGDTLIIDSESMDVLVNGEPNVEAWQLGSTFFNLQKGTNTLAIYDDAGSRTLLVTVIWSDYWL